jgi:hypothetical protein
MLGWRRALNLMYVKKNNSSYNAPCHIESIAEKDDLWPLPEMQDKE